MRARLRQTTLACAFGLLSVLGVWAQEPGSNPQASGPNTGSSPDGALPGQNATTPGASEHSSNTTNPAQPVPGAMPDSQTVPSTLSARNAAEDKLVIVAFAVKDLTDDQRRQLAAMLKDKPAPQVPANAEVGAAVPDTLELPRIPDEVAARIPLVKGYGYARAGNRILLIDPVGSFVVGAIDA
jgi:hypothetical protein